MIFKKLFQYLKQKFSSKKGSSCNTGNEESCSNNDKVLNSPTEEETEEWEYPNQRIGILIQSQQKRNAIGNKAETTSPIKYPGFHFAKENSFNPCFSVMSFKQEICDPDFENTWTRFFALDVETTGLDKIFDRIIEISVILFNNGKIEDKFTSLINAHTYISEDTQKINHITNDMENSAPSEEEVYSKLVLFLGDALDHKTPICAHNSKFDMAFLDAVLSRLGYKGNIRVVDTYSLSKETVFGVENRKLSTLADYFKLDIQPNHRAESDAETCGKLFLAMVPELKRRVAYEKSTVERGTLNHFEMVYCSYIYNSIIQINGEIDYLRFVQDGHKSITASYLGDQFLRINFGDEYNTILLETKYLKKYNLFIIPKDSILATNREFDDRYLENDYSFVVFLKLSDLSFLPTYLKESYPKFCKIMKSYYKRTFYSDSFREQKEEDAMYNYAKLLPEAVSSALKDMNTIDQTQKFIEYKEEIEATKKLRSQIVIQPTYIRKPLEEILVSTNEKEFSYGITDWEGGEKELKGKKYEEALKLFDKSRAKGFNSPSLYYSYAKLFKDTKQYDDEISILDEFFERNSKNPGVIISLVEKMNKACKSLNIVQGKKEAEKKKDIRKKEKQEKLMVMEKQKEENKEKALAKYRAVVQIDNCGNIIKEFPSINEAERETGINNKSIRDALSGRQKHAGGFAWKDKN